MENILRINAGSSNVYLIKNGHNSILIDAGNKNKLKKILKTVTQQGLNESDIKLIILTHTHYDHSGSVAELKKATGAKVAVSAKEAEELRNGYTPFPKGTTPFFKFIVKIGKKFFSSMGKFSPVEPDILIKDKYDLSDYDLNGYIVSTPGHTIGSLSVILDNKYAILGDTAFSIFPQVYPPFANDPGLLRQTWKKLLDLGITQCYPGHGKPFSVEKLQHTYKKKFG
jgi:glyoxylase-like metal-dependent hydrolase (beta-lactamase superfamily II)